MSGPTLYDIDVDVLFEQRSIPEIEEVQKRVQSEIEKKREELRTMVGERYRDLLKAADTIARMKDTSATLITQIQNITTNCTSLNEKQLLGFQTKPKQPLVPDRELHSYYSTVFQIKLLTSLPEMIWSRIDEEQFFLATQLFILSRHISTGLHLDVGNKVIKHFPVAKKQWETLKPFFFTIKQNALCALEKDTLTPEAATDCLLSLFLLEQSSMDGILTTFLQIRAKSYLAALSSDKSAQRRVKDRILSSLEVLNSSVLLIFKCFIDSGNGKGLVVEKLEELASDKAEPTISLMDLDEMDMMYDLPDIIAKFKPTFEMPTITPTMLKSVKDTWLQTVSKIIENQLKNLFDLVSSMKTIQEIKHQSSKLEKDKNWSEMCEKLSLPASLDFYQHYYRPLINSRVRDIVRQSWSKAVSSTHNDIESLLTSSSIAKISENNLKNLWKENVGDIPVSLKQALQQDKKNNKLLMKSKGFCPEIVDICASLDNRLKTIFSEVNVLLEEDSSGQTDEKQSMVNFLKNTSEDCISELITGVKSMEFDRKQDTCILLARLFTAFADLCPHLKLCLSHTYVASNWDRISSDKKNYEKWNRVCALFDDEAFAFWKQFCETFAEEMGPEQIISNNIGIETILNDFTSWESINIEEKDDQDNAVQSTIRVPSQPRISVQFYVFKLIYSLNNSIPETLPRRVLHHLNSILATKILALYGKYIENEFVATNQNAALQLYFDLKFFQLVFLARDDKKVQDEVQRITNALKNFVDPFDFELFHSYLNGNVKKCAQRLQHELGVLIPYPENVSILADQKPSAGAQDRDPNVLCLSSNGAVSTWFPLLPIITPGSKTGTMSNEGEKGSGAKSKRQSDTKLTSSQSSSSLASAQQTAQNYASNVRSGAAAFFGAMSQEWFR